MDSIIRSLYWVYEPKEKSPEERSAMEAARPVMDEMQAKLSREEFDRFWSAVLDIGTADAEGNFVQGFRMGARLMLDILSGE